MNNSIESDLNLIRNNNLFQYLDFPTNTSPSTSPLTSPTITPTIITIELPQQEQQQQVESDSNLNSETEINGQNESLSDPITSSTASDRARETLIRIENDQINVRNNERESWNYLIQMGETIFDHRSTNPIPLPPILPSISSFDSIQSNNLITSTNTPTSNSSNSLVDPELIESSTLFLNSIQAGIHSQSRRRRLTTIVRLNGTTDTTADSNNRLGNINPSLISNERSTSNSNSNLVTGSTVESRSWDSEALEGYSGEYGGGYSYGVNAGVDSDEESLELEQRRTLNRRYMAEAEALRNEYWRNNPIDVPRILSYPFRDFSTSPRVPPPFQPRVPPPFQQDDILPTVDRHILSDGLFPPSVLEPRPEESIDELEWRRRSNIPIPFSTNTNTSTSISQQPATESSAIAVEPGNLSTDEEEAEESEEREFNPWRINFAPTSFAEHAVRGGLARRTEAELIAIIANRVTLAAGGHDRREIAGGGGRGEAEFEVYDSDSGWNDFTSTIPTTAATATANTSSINRLPSLVGLRNSNSTFNSYSNGVGNRRRNRNLQSQSQSGGNYPESEVKLIYCGATIDNSGEEGEEEDSSLKSLPKGFKIQRKKRTRDELESEVAEAQQLEGKETKTGGCGILICARGHSNSNSTLELTNFPNEDNYDEVYFNLDQLYPAKLQTSGLRRKKDSTRVYLEKTVRSDAPPSRDKVRDVLSSAEMKCIVTSYCSGCKIKSFGCRNCGNILGFRITQTCTSPSCQYTNRINPTKTTTEPLIWNYRQSSITLQTRYNSITPSPFLISPSPPSSSTTSTLLESTAMNWNPSPSSSILIPNLKQELTSNLISKERDWELDSKNHFLEFNGINGDRVSIRNLLGRSGGVPYNDEGVRVGGERGEGNEDSLMGFGMIEREIKEEEDLDEDEEDQPSYPNTRTQPMNLRTTPSSTIRTGFNPNSNSNNTNNTNNSNSNSNNFRSPNPYNSIFSPPLPSPSPSLPNPSSTGIAGTQLIRSRAIRRLASSSTSFSTGSGSTPSTTTQTTGGSRRNIRIQSLNGNGPYGSNNNDGGGEDGGNGGNGGNEQEEEEGRNLYASGSNRQQLGFLNNSHHLHHSQSQAHPRSHPHSQPSFTTDSTSTTTSTTTRVRSGVTGRIRGSWIERDRDTRNLDHNLERILGRGRREERVGR